jgi:hypothetical protein
MEDHPFDALVRRWRRWPALPRRALLGGIVGLAGGAAGAPVRAGGCKRAGRKCRRDRDCCGGACRGGACRATLGGTCEGTPDVCDAGFVAAACNRSLDDGCACWTRVEGGRYCGQGSAGCITCTSDDQCRRIYGFEAGCVVASSGTCTCAETTACVRRCPRR